MDAHEQAPKIHVANLLIHFGMVSYLSLSNIYRNCPFYYRDHILQLGIHFVKVCARHGMGTLADKGINQTEYNRVAEIKLNYTRHDKVIDKETFARETAFHEDKNRQSVTPFFVDGYAGRKQIPIRLQGTIELSCQRTLIRLQWSSNASQTISVGNCADFEFRAAICHSA